MPDTVEVKPASSNSSMYSWEWDAKHSRLRRQRRSRLATKVVVVIGLGVGLALLYLWMTETGNEDPKRIALDVAPAERTSATDNARPDNASQPESTVSASEFAQLVEEPIAPNSVSADAVPFEPVRSEQVAPIRAPKVVQTIPTTDQEKADAEPQTFDNQVTEEMVPSTVTTRKQETKKPAVWLEGQDSVITSSAVARAQLTSGIQDREPIDNIGSRLVTDGLTDKKLYYFTEIRNLAGHSIRHLWEYEGDIVAEKSFAIGGIRWRVFSSKRLLPSMMGKWRAIVVDEKGRVLRSDSFLYEE